MRALALFALFVSGCASMMPVPPPPPTFQHVEMTRFDRVDDNVFRSSQPSADEWRRLVDGFHVASVLKLNHGGEPSPTGVKVIYEPLDPLGNISQATLDRILDELEQAPKPVLIHCTHGEDRTGLIVALYKIKHGASINDAYADMVRHRFHPYSGLWAAWLHATGWDH